ncbi:hypothetical protein Prudu_001067 [Prunus dulcis]|uniref:Uncharacterized protein n=1 Tax=Prunus dulcis TaxID=3755 RepID=A0A4Y1QMQ2_PRUDU|nr:hypothetical protein Prudu_001067 [Prunus dulcis]
MRKSVPASARVFFLMTTTALRLSFHPSPHSLARGACPLRQPLSNSLITFPTPNPTLHSSTLIPFHRSHRRRQSPITMSDSGRSSSPAAQPPPMELNEESDFETILSPDGYISICGFGSLLSGREKREEYISGPDQLQSCALNGFRRVYAHMAPIFFERGIAKPETKEIASLSVEPCEGESLIVTVFEITKSEVLPETLMGSHLIIERYFVLVIVMKSSSELDAKEVRRCIFSYLDDMALIRSGEMISYLVALTFGIAKNLSEVAYNNFLDHTFLGDRKTTIRLYLATTGSGIMEEEPPESLKTRINMPRQP